MKLKMREDDRRAMDVLMDRAVTALGKPNGTIYAAVDGRLRERVSQVEKVLGILDNMPAADPPRNLLAKTLRFVESSTGENLTRNRPSAPGIYNNHQSHLA
ncbi:MAG TPA: hypothetical protein VFE47_20060 [Tepidisphaeraceae bacterium]|nr:hypothetical protein [Tepidisphaeraceae bacterium]